MQFICYSNISFSRVLWAAAGSWRLSRGGTSVPVVCQEVGGRPMMCLKRIVIGRFHVSVLESDTNVTGLCSCQVFRSVPRTLTCTGTQHSYLLVPCHWLSRCADVLGGSQSTVRCMVYHNGGILTFYMVGHDHDVISSNRLLPPSNRYCHYH